MAQQPNTDWQIGLEDEEETEETPIFESWCVTQAKKQRYRFSWTIEDFTRHAESLATGQVLKSCVFSAEEREEMLWRLHLYPRGNVEANKDYLSVFLVLFSSALPEVSTTISVSLLGRDHSEVHTVATRRAYTFSHMSPTLCTWGHPAFLSLDTLMEDPDTYLPDDCLTIVCEGAILSPDVNTSGVTGMMLPNGQQCSSSMAALGGSVSVQGVSELAGDLGTILKTEQFADVTLVVKDRRIRAHRAILGSRSPMLGRILEQNRNEEVTLTGIDPEVLDGMLYFIYTGQNPCLCTEKNLDRYLVAAHMLELQRLKASCETGLSQQIDANTAPALLKLADETQASNLRMAVHSFLRKNAP